MTLRTLVGRVEKLERGLGYASDADILAFGRAVTDDELQALVDRTGRWLRENDCEPEPFAEGAGIYMTDAEQAEFWRKCASGHRGNEEAEGVSDEDEIIDGETGQPDGPRRRIDLCTLRDIRKEMAYVNRALDRGELKSQEATHRV